MKFYLIVLAGVVNLYLALAGVTYAMQVPFIGWLLGIVPFAIYTLITMVLIHLLEGLEND